MESNTIYMTKREFYSVAVSILGYILLMLVFSEKVTWHEYVLSFLIAPNLIFYAYKVMKEKSRSACSSRAEK